MNRRLVTFVTAVVFLCAGAGSAFAETAKWDVDSAHSAAQFTVRHLMISNVKGEFGKLTGVIQLDEKNVPRSSVEVSIDATTVNTREPKRDAHLRSADFLDVGSFPTMTFRSTRITPAGPGKFKMAGDLTLHGVTREVTFDVEGPTPAIKDPWGNLRSGVSATARINRKDFGVKWNGLTESGGLIVGDEVAIAIDIEMVKKAPAAAPGNGK